MTDTNTFVVAAVLLIGAFFQVLTALRIRAERKRLAHMLLVERIRAHFAVPRHTLTKLAIEGKIDVNSNAFHSLYQIMTFILRRPDQYKELSDVLAKELLNGVPEGSGTRLKSELSVWPSEAKSVISEIANGMGLLVVEVSPRRRLLYGIGRSPVVRPVLLWLVKRYQYTALHEHLSTSAELKQVTESRVILTAQSELRLAAA